MRPTVAIIDLDKLQNNIKVLKNKLPDQTALMAVVKANAYGHGAIKVARNALLTGASWLGVAIPEEGAELREAGIKEPILILGAVEPSQIDLIVRYRLQPCVFSYDVLEELNRQAMKLGQNIGVHVKIDTGMGRIGLRDEDEILRFCSIIKEMESVYLDGVFTHFAAADDPSPNYTYMQMERFNKIVTSLRNSNINIPWIHAANSAAILRYPAAQFNMVRAGISMYGYYPWGCKLDFPQLEPILEWRTRVVFVKKISQGESISYGRTYTADKDRIIATLPLGYADGYNRLLSNRGWVLIKGKKAPIVGTICMDQFMVDVTDIPNVKPGDTAILLGRQGDEVITADDLARLCNTISYEILVNISSRVPRVYIGGSE